MDTNYFKKVRIGDVCEVVGGSTPRTSNVSFWEGEILWLSPSDLPEVGTISYVYDTARKLTAQGFKSSKLRMLPVGSVTYSTRASIGKIGLVSIPLCTNQGFTNLIPSEEIDQLYLAYALKHYTEAIKNLGNSTTFVEISRKALANFQIPLPPLETQRAIAAKLDAADRLRQLDQQLLTKYDELAQALFIDLFGDPVKNEKGWEVKRLADVCVRITDGTHHSPPSAMSGVPYITAKHVKKGKLAFEEKPTFISFADHESIFARCNPEKGDVLYIKDGATTGIAAVNDRSDEFSMLSSLALLKPNANLIDSYFLMSFLNFEDVKVEYLRKHMAGAAIQRFTLAKIKSFELIVPPINLQRAYSKALIEIIESQGKLSMKSTNNLFQSFLHESFF